MGIGAGTIHPDLAVMIDGHESEPRVHNIVDDGYVEAV